MIEELSEKELDKFQKVVDGWKELAETIRKNGEEIAKTITEHGI